MRATTLLLTAAFASLLPGCANREPKVAAPAPASAPVKTYVGQMQYRAADGRSVIGEFAAGSSADGVFAFELRSGPGVPLLRLRETGDQADLEGLLARAGWRGTASRAPAELQGWLALNEVFAEVARGKRGTTPVAGAVAEISDPSNAGERIVVDAAGGDRFTLQVSR